jgi:hypothetical protein
VGCRDGALPGDGSQKVEETAEAECDEMVGEVETYARWRQDVRCGCVVVDGGRSWLRVGR